MWRLAPGLELHGGGASLRYALKLARNLAISEARRLRTIRRVDIEEVDDDPGVSVPPDPIPDPRLRRAILACVEKLPSQPRAALDARIHEGGIRPDRDLARGLEMQLNTFLQNIVRARRFVAACLEKAGLPLKEILP